MLINGFTVFAQAINFLILVWLLKRFLYKPILHAIDVREKGIASRLAEAEAKLAEGQKERDDFRVKNDDFDKDRSALLAKARDEANAERVRLIDLAQKDADALRAKRQDAARTEQRQLNLDIVRWTQKQVFAITRKALGDLAGSSLEDRMCEVFVGRLRGLDGVAKDQMSAALGASPFTALIRCAVELPAAQRAEIESAVKETFDAKTRVQYQTAPDLVSGIELSANGQKVAWSIADYLATLEKSAGELLRGNSGAEPTPDPKTKPAGESAAQAKPTAKPVLQKSSSAPKAHS